MTNLLNTILFFSSALIIISFCSITSPQSDCSRFRVGAFFYHSKIDNSNTIIERNDSIQTELSVQTGTIIKARIKWTGDCEYELQYSTQKSVSNDSITNAIKTKPLKTVILKTGRDYYIFKSTMDGVDMTLIDTLKILKNKNL